MHKIHIWRELGGVSPIENLSLRIDKSNGVMVVHSYHDNSLVPEFLFYGSRSKENAGRWHNWRWKLKGNKKKIAERINDHPVPALRDCFGYLEIY